MLVFLVKNGWDETLLGGLTVDENKRRQYHFNILFLKKF